MEYKQFSDLINQTVFSDYKAKLLVSIARQPDNFIGLFRPTKPEVKIAQNLSQSHEIKFGYAFENLVREYLGTNDCDMLSNVININGQRKEMDIHFRKDNKIFVVEQKIRDNHDSTKKRGQINDFEEKLVTVSENGQKEISGILFFVDPGLSKNKRFYEKALAKINADHGIKTHLLYGGAFFDLLSLSWVWSEIESHLTQWRAELPGFPEFNYDKDPEDSFDEIKSLNSSDLKKLFEHKEIGKHILPILFPDGKTLELLAEYWLNQNHDSYISQLIQKRMAEINNAS